MPNCHSCKRSFSGFHKYCDLCRCKTTSCESPRYQARSKCRTHSGLCKTKGCTGKIAEGKTLCPACDVGSRQPSSDRDLRENALRRGHVYAAELRSTPSYREHIRIVSSALLEIGATKAFNDNLDSIVGWKNLKSWMRWAGGSLEPTILRKARFTAIIEILTPAMFDAGMRRAYFADKFLEEMILVCRAEQDKADVSFVVETAFMVFGPLLAPLSAAAGSAVGGGIAGTAVTSSISAGRSLAQVGVTAGGTAATVDSRSGATINADEMSAVSAISGLGVDEWDVPTRGRSATVLERPSVSAPPLASKEGRYHYSVNPMQYAMALFKYLTTVTAGKADLIVIKEFGGASVLANLYERIKHPPD